MEIENLLRQSISDDFSIEASSTFTFDQFKSILQERINYLINHDFHRLASILYRVDVSESKLRKLLHDHSDEAAGNIISELIIERQLQKIKSREQFKSQEEIPDDEKW
jgi:hypothetical protein